MSDIFPHDLIIDILIKLPVKSPLKFKSVRRLWRSLIEDRQFIKFHSDQCKSDINCQKFFMYCLGCTDDQYYYYSVNAPFQHDYDVSLIEHLPKIDYPLGPAFVNSCNGLFLLVFPSDKIVLWNPTIRESRRIPSPILKRRDRWRLYAIYGFGYVCSMDDYKIVRLGCKGHSNDYDFEIFSTSNSWNLIRKFSPADYFSARDFVFVDGIVYMMVVNDLSKTSNQHKVYIEYFCLEKEQFGELLFPYQLQIKDGPALHALGENLCLIRLVHHDSMHNFEVWRITKNGKSFSWSKILSLPWWEDNLQTYRIRPVTFIKDGDVLFLMDRTKFVVYNSSIHKFEQVKVVGRETSCPFSWIVTYVETLFSPN